MTIKEKSTGVSKKRCAFFSLAETKYYCPEKHAKSSFAGEIKDGSSTGSPFVFSKEFRKAIDDLFKD
ncbi:MAG: hypothetical protein II897_10890 [Clostridia bacterium]|nr:hypothetical protein [Clostridia bacterium]